MLSSGASGAAEGSASDFSRWVWGTRSTGILMDAFADSFTSRSLLEGPGECGRKGRGFDCIDSEPTVGEHIILLI
jgi:hypothetical protein